MRKRVSWLNLHEHVLIRDVRKLIYSYLDACDREAVEMAHGVRKRATFESIKQWTRANYFELVQDMRQKGLYDRWSWKELGSCIASRCDTDFVLWYAMCTMQCGVCRFKVQETILKTCICQGNEFLFKKLCLEYAWHHGMPVYAFLATENNIELAQWYFWKTSCKRLYFPDIRYALLEEADLEFLKWLEQKVEFMYAFTIGEKEQLFDKWPEFKQWHRGKRQCV